MRTPEFQCNKYKMHRSLDDCFHFWSAFIRVHEDWKRVIEDNVDDQRYVGYPIQTSVKQLHLCNSSGWKS